MTTQVFTLVVTHIIDGIEATTIGWTGIDIHGWIETVIDGRTEIDIAAPLFRGRDIFAGKDLYIHRE